MPAKVTPKEAKKAISSVSTSGFCVERENFILTGDTHLETGGLARLPAQVAGRWGHTNWISVWWGKKYFVHCWPEQPRQDKSLFYRHDELNEPTNKGPLSFVLFKSPFTSVSTISRGHPSLQWSLILTLKLESQETAFKELMLAGLLMRLHRLGCGEGYHYFNNICTFCILLSQKALTKAQ